jgi:hypothetical protein
MESVSPPKDPAVESADPRRNERLTATTGAVLPVLIHQRSFYLWLIVVITAASCDACGIGSAEPVSAPSAAR